MKFCTNCGKAITDDAAFCTGCGASTGAAPVTNTTGQTVNTATVPEQTPTQGTYTQGSTGAYYQPSAGAGPGVPNYQQPLSQSTPGGYNQPGAGAGQNSPYYQNAPYGGGPNYQAGGPRKNNKMVVIIVSVIIGLAIIGGGIYAILASKGNKTSLSGNNSSVSAMPSAEPSATSIPSAEPSPEPSPSVSDVVPGGEGLAIFDASTQDNIIAACEETGIDVSKIVTVEYYGAWNEGDVYTFIYDDSVVDLLLYSDETVFSIETGGVQLYLTGYESYLIDDYTGSTTHFDESYPDNGYAFYLNGVEVNTSVTFNTSPAYDYVVELIDQRDGSLATAFYVHAGTSWQMAVPEGDYIIQYAAGSSWQGVDYLFGTDTVFYRSDSIYSFYPENESTIDLLFDSDSGIPSTEITIDEFINY